MSRQREPDRKSHWPPPGERALLRRLAGALLAGAIGGAFAAAGLIAADIGGIRALTIGPAGEWIGALLLVWGMAVLFGFIGLGISIMSLGDWSDPPLE